MSDAELIAMIEKQQARLPAIRGGGSLLGANSPPELQRATSKPMVMLETGVHLGNVCQVVSLLSAPERIRDDTS